MDKEDLWVLKENNTREFTVNSTYRILKGEDQPGERSRYV